MICRVSLLFVYYQFLTWNLCIGLAPGNLTLLHRLSQAASSRARYVLFIEIKVSKIPIDINVTT